ncbi:MAG: hypothetical protein CMLOHMNK_01316 [Steroidobacteraceae bacterium]|nr:hypothetical protein [Steroidobacteraceae bacterium]
MSPPAARAAAASAERFTAANSAPPQTPAARVSMAARRFVMPRSSSARVLRGSGAGAASVAPSLRAAGATAAGVSLACVAMRGSTKNTSPIATTAARIASTRPVRRRPPVRTDGSGASAGGTTTSSAGPAACSCSRIGSGNSTAIVPPSSASGAVSIGTIGAVPGWITASGGGRADSLSTSDSIVTVSCRQVCSSSITARIVAGRPSRVFASMRITSAMSRGGAGRTGFSSAAGSSSTRRSSKRG